MAWSDGLSDEQIQAASHYGCHARLLAGPGTGKTVSLVRRIEYLIAERRIDPDQIVALTFTRKAAGNLREEVKKRLAPLGYPMPRVSTLHSFALRQLVRNPGLTDLPQPLRVADDFEERYVVVEDLKSMLGLDVDSTKECLKQLSADWETLQPDQPDWELNFGNAEFLGAWKEHRWIYGYTLRAEMAYQLKRALERSGEFSLEGPPQFLLVDEYQDLNRCDLAVVRELATRGAEVFCVGDDDQSIYGFRFSDPEGIRQFTEEYQPSNSLTLEECRRCDRAILALGEFVIRLDYRRAPKVIRPRQDAGPGLVKIRRFGDQYTEARGIASLCKRLISRQNCPPDEILILLRADDRQRLSTPIKTALEREGIPAQTAVDPLAPFNDPRQPAGRRLLCALRLVCDQRDYLAWRVWLEFDKNRVGKKTISRVYELAAHERIGFVNALQRVCADPKLVPITGHCLAEAVRNIHETVERIGESADDDVLAQIRLAAEMLIADDIARSECVTLLERIYEEAAAGSLGDLVRAIQASLGKKEQESRPDKVKLMTMHQAKGLPADAVIIAAAEDEYLPGRNVNTPAEDDERRLLYVSLTRARRYLFVTYCDRRTGNQEYTGRNARSPDQAIRQRRTLTSFLRDAPFHPEDGRRYLASLS